MRHHELLAVLDPNKVKPGWIALILVLILLLATVLLWRSMNSQLRKINVPTRREVRERERRASPGSTDPAVVDSSSADAEARPRAADDNSTADEDSGVLGEEPRSGG